MKKVIAALIAALALPVSAQAHTGAVTCDKSGVVFSYNANFAHTTQVTEVVNGVSTVFVVPAGTAVKDTLPLPAAQVTASATWKDGNASGSIPQATLSCPYTPPACTPTTVTVDRPVEVPGPTVYVDRPVPGPETRVTVTRTITKWKVRWRDRWHIKLVEWHKIPGKKKAGVTG